MEYLIVYGIGIIIWFMISVLVSGYKMEPLNSWTVFKNSLIWIVEVLYILGLSLKIFKIKLKEKNDKI